MYQSAWGPMHNAHYLTSPWCSVAGAQAKVFDQPLKQGWPQLDFAFFFAKSSQGQPCFNGWSDR